MKIVASAVGTLARRAWLKFVYRSPGVTEAERLPVCLSLQLARCPYSSMQTAVVTFACGWS